MIFRSAAALLLVLLAPPAAVESVPAGEAVPTAEQTPPAQDRSTSDATEQDAPEQDAPEREVPEKTASDKAAPEETAPDTAAPDQVAPDDSNAVSAEPVRREGESDTDATLARARLIYDLLAERLEPEQRIGPMFAFDPRRGTLAELTSFLASVQAARQRNEASRRRRFRHPKYPSAETLSAIQDADAAHEALRDAQFAFLSLPKAERQRLLEVHRKRQAELRAEGEVVAEKRSVLAERLVQATELERFIEGQLEQQVDVRALLMLELRPDDVDTRLVQLIGECEDAAKDEAPPPEVPVAVSPEAPNGDGAEAPAPERVPEPEPETDPESETDPDAPDVQTGDDLAPTPGTDEAAEDDIDAADTPEAPLVGEALEAWARAEADNVEPADLDAALRDAQRRIDVAILSFVKLSADARLALLDAHDNPVPEVVEVPEQPEDEAAAEVAERLDEAQREVNELTLEREEAQEDADDATTETGRLIAEERARLIGVKEAQARYEVSLAAQEKAVLQERETVLRDRRRMTKRIAAFANGSSEEDPYEVYDDAVESLRAARRELRDALRTVRGPSGAPRAHDVDRGLANEVDRAEHRALRRELDERAAELSRVEAKIRWRIAKTRRDNVNTLAEVRAQLLDALPWEVEEEVTGFGPRGRTQILGELMQLELEGRWLLASTPRWAQRSVEAARADTSGTIIAAGKLVAMLVAFFWLRRRSDGIFEWAVRRNSKRRRSRTSRFVLTVLHYARHVQGPVEYLALAFALAWMFADPDGNPAMDRALSTVSMLLIGATVLRLAEAAAVRGQGKRKESAKLVTVRLRSIRLIVGVVLFIGLGLIGVQALLDRGAIFRWTLRLCWWLVMPLTLLLLIWWRSTIIERLQSRAEPGALVRFILAQDTGLRRLITTPVGALVLLGDGIYRMALRQAARFAVLKHAFAFVLRHRAAKGGQVDFSSGAYRPLPAELYEALSPSAPATTIDETIAHADISAAADLLAASPGAFVAIIGPRGSGRSTTVRRLAERVGRSRVLTVDCPVGGVDDLAKAVQKAAGLTASGDGPPDLADLLSRAEADVLAIDGLHRLSRPHVGGLKELDALLQAIRDADSDVAWIVTLEDAAWQYIRRAWDAEAMFDYTIRLGAWDEEAIERLVGSRSEAAGVEANFEELEVPQQLLVDVTLTEEERNEQAFYQILWDYTGGNPGLALSFWRDSLVDVGGGSLSVRLFVAPPTTELDGLPAICYFTLRAVAQLEFATVAELVQCTNLRPAEVSNAIRPLVAKGCVQRTDRGFRITTKWYPAAIRVLRRKHLLGQ